MKARVIAKIDIPVYAAEGENGSYLVFSLDDTHEISLGDVLSGDFDAASGLHLPVQNLTTQRAVRVCLEDWDCTRAHALQRLRQLGASSEVWTIP